MGTPDTVPGATASGSLSPGDEAGARRAPASTTLTKVQQATADKMAELVHEVCVRGGLSDREEAGLLFAASTHLWLKAAQKAKGFGLIDDQTLLQCGIGMSRKACGLKAKR